MNPLSGLAGVAVDRMLGLPGRAVRYAVRPDVAVAMPDGVVLLGDLYRPAGDDRPRPVVLIRSPYGRAGLPGMVCAAPLARRGFQVFIQTGAADRASVLRCRRSLTLAFGLLLWPSPLLSSAVGYADSLRSRAMTAP